MPRRLRICPVGIPQHIIQRGNNRQVCFVNDEDMAAYANWLYEASQKFQVQIHAWVFMNNHIHLLVTPMVNNGVSKMMQYVGRYYVLYFNRAYRRAGTLWEGRFKSCLVQDNDYFLHCQRYIELNPVRAGMVEDPADYQWSSYQANALGLKAKLITPHELYMSLGPCEATRQAYYRSLFQRGISTALITDIRSSLNRGLALGNERFKAQVEALTGQPVRLQKRGPKPKNVEEVNEFLL